MDGIEIKLLMSFMTSSGRKVSLFVTDPREDVTETEIKQVMDLIIEKNIFAPNGEDIVSAKEAKIALSLVQLQKTTKKRIPQANVITKGRQSIAYRILVLPQNTFYIYAEALHFMAPLAPFAEREIIDLCTEPMESSVFFLCLRLLSLL